MQGRVLHEVEVEICEGEEVTCDGDGVMVRSPGWTHKGL